MKHILNFIYLCIFKNVMSTLATFGTVGFSSSDWKGSLYELVQWHLQETS